MLDSCRANRAQLIDKYEWLVSTGLGSFDISALDSKETALEMEKLSEYIM
jgi:hypothetical protein